MVIIMIHDHILGQSLINKNYISNSTNFQPYEKHEYLRISLWIK